MSKQITITLKISELLYDIENDSFLIGRSRENGQNAEAVANIQASADSESRNRILRSITKRLAEIKACLAEKLNEGATSASNDPVAESNIVLVLNMHDDYNTNFTSYLANSMHDYLVNGALCDWFGVTAKELSAEYAMKAEAAKVDIITYKDVLTTRRRRKTSPF